MLLIKKGDKCYLGYFSVFLHKTCAVTPHQNHLGEMVLLKSDNMFLLKKNGENDLKSRSVQSSR